MIKDIMPGFELYQPTSLADALGLADRFGKNGWKMAGGKDSLDWFKDRVKQDKATSVLPPKAVIELTGLAELKGVKETADGVEIGALTTLTELETNAVINAQYGVLAAAARRVASPQIRNAGTIGGNVAQDSRCWYYRYGLPCYRAGGNTCYADTPAGMNREHALFEASRCVSVSPSDTAPALVALEAKMVVRSSKGERVIDAENFFVLPGADITRMTVLEPGDILTAIRLPAKWAGAKFYFEKVADRNTWDFALVNIAAVKLMDGDTVKDVRIAAGGVQNSPKRLKVVEDTVKGQKITPELAQLAGNAATRGARPLNYNHFKVPLLANLVSRALRAA
jgi:xanthine dehydrogenase YagS FAD-binding subunit